MKDVKNVRMNVVITTWNSRSYIYDALESLGRQTFQDFNLIIVDNGSVDDTVAFIRQHYPQIYILKNFKNNGFSKAYNQGIKLGTAELVVCMNHDVILDSECLKNLVAAAETHPRAGAIGPKVLRLFRERLDPDNKRGDMHELIYSDIIDTAGIEMKRSREFTNRGEGQNDTPEFSRTLEVFGISACLTLYRREALEDVKILNEYFDEDFFAYKEDIDLSWRLNLMGWGSLYCAEAKAYHHRGFAKSEEHTLKSVSNYRQRLSRRVRALSFTNQHFVTLKNDTLKNILPDVLPILWREIKILAYACIREQFLFREIGKIFGKIPLMLHKRRLIFARAKEPAIAIRRWIH